MKPLIVLVFIIILTAVCRNPDSETTPEKHNATHSGLPQLNDGQKWKANPETTVGIRNMSLLITGLPQHASAEDYHLAKVELEKEFETILKKCTMTGEAHNQLHTYLLPMKDLMVKFDSGSPAERKRASDDLSRHLSEYDTYFE